MEKRKNCPVCANPLNGKKKCPVCGYELTKDYERYETIGKPLKGVVPEREQRKRWESKKNSNKNVLLVAVGILVVCLIGCIGTGFFLKKQNEALKKNLETMSSSLEAMRNQLNSLESENVANSEQQSQSINEQSEEISSDTDTESENHTLTIGDEVQFGKYQGEEIDWRVLDVEDGKALLLSDKALDTKPYDEGDGDVTWETCTLRKWLNEEFHQEAFNAEERDAIQEVHVKNDKNAEYGTDGGEDTRDRIYLLSLREVEEYFQSNEDRKCEATKYAINQGCWVSSEIGTSTWWLRSPGFSSKLAAYVYCYGSLDSYGHYVNLGTVGVRPALWVEVANLKS